MMWNATSPVTSAALVASLALVASACGGSEREHVSRKSALPPSVARALATVRCYTPAPRAFGFVETQGSCAHVIRVARASPGRNVWRVRLRLPPVYCIVFRPGVQYDDVQLDTEVGAIEEIRCPRSVYPNDPTPDLPVRLRAPRGKRAGAASLTAVDANHSRLIAHSGMDTGWIQSGTCQAPTGPHLFELNEFYSSRSDTTIPISVDALRRTPHVVLLDVGGAHGGEPVACAVIK